MLLTLLAACKPVAVPPAADRGPVPAVEAPAPVLKRLTATQYENTVHALLGESIVVPDDLEPDEAVNGLLSVGASVSSLSPLGVEQYENAAFDVAAQGVAGIVGCAPAGSVDDGCARETLDAFGRRAWRRPLTPEELDVLVALAGTAGAVAGDFEGGLVYAIAAILQSPYFVYRVELGEDGRYTDWEMASRLSYFLWNTLPDDALLDAAAAGELTTDAGLSAQIDRLLADDRARDGVRNFFGEMLTLYALDELSKDPTVFVHMSEQVGPSAREETLRGLEYLVFEEDGDYRDAMTTQRTFLDRKLAAIYDVPAPSRDGFGETTLPDDGGRRGLLGQVSTLALHAHPTATSVTRRGVFVREVLLCMQMPDPPADVDTSIPEASGEAPTMRERVARHLEDPMCAGCHNTTDPIGLGLENFDGLGGWRTRDNDAVIDASGTLDGADFADAWGLAQALHDHARLGPCLSDTLYQYATAHAAGDDEEALMEWHAEGFTLSGFKVSFLLRDIAMSPAFREVGETE